MPKMGATRNLMLLVALCSMSLGGCAQITVLTDQEPPRSEWKFGVLSIDLADSNKNTIIQSTGVGLVSTPSGVTLGYANARIVRIGDECRLVVTVKDFDSLNKDEQLSQLLKSTAKACPV
jgi:hypothetical protein